MRTYIAGPMSNLPLNNYPAFHAAAWLLRDLGMHVENPAENDPPPCGTWLGYMRLALRQLSTCDAVVMLPGWMWSRGARIEWLLAKLLGLRVMSFSRALDEHGEPMQ
jgi:hypothetical protein